MLFIPAKLKGAFTIDVQRHHGFNLLAVPSKEFIENDLFRIVYDLSRKLIRAN